MTSYETLFLLSNASASKNTTQLYLFSNHLLKLSAFFAFRFTCIYSFFRDSIALIGSASD